MTQRRRKADDPIASVDDAKSTYKGAEVSVPAESAAEARLADWLVQLAGDRVRTRLDREDPEHAAFFEWQAVEARAAQTPAERTRTAREAEAFARDMLRRMRDLDLGGETEATLEAPMSSRHAFGMREEPPATLRTPRVIARGREAVRQAALDHRVARFPFGVAAGAGHDIWDEPPDAWIDLPDDVPAGQHVALLVHGDSMAPMLHDGDTILVRLRHDVAVGDVVVARRPDDGYVVKRVERVNDSALVLSSCNPLYSDIEVPNDPVFITGTVVLRWRVPR